MTPQMPSLRNTTPAGASMLNQKIPELLTPQEIAEILKIPLRQFTERVSKREGFPAPLDVKITGIRSRRWKKDEIINWIQNGGKAS